MIKTPLVSIIIPSFNREALIGRTIDSILDQTYSNWECIIVDDGSTDNTKSILKEYCKKDSRIQYFDRPNIKPKGANSCRNFGFEKSKGSYLQWLDSDDLLSSNKLELQINDLLEEDTRTIATCGWNFFEDRIEKLDNTKQFPVYNSFDNIPKFLDALALSGGFLPNHSYLIHRSIIHLSGNWLENLLINQDGEFFSRIFINMNKVVYNKNCAVYYRRNREHNVSNIESKQKVLHAIYSWNLIENNFKIRFGEPTRLVLISKKYIYIRLKDTYPELIEEYETFFKNCLPIKVSFIQKAFFKIKRFLK
ncbi:glycosyltransferase family 2 protein [Ulvibacter litoralis]|uniref:Glycosyltransferase involved in cell wall bisynthesis n=1 Tax=Ulvibacter litoralis TaxID=227084 RepID=A0A1G7GV38_9FLAO|nr:glycosyltransferase family 2 protein [Ulvibacter litoralis]GHC59996.1 hypothetical protein GCM10008083_26250 [Ulvibacter litoralis]SDE91971.1 Glycosyltransferase involved in cell wall bisynthesis [Ulvibacter litoralis]